MNRNCADCIQEEADVCEVDMDHVILYHVILWLDVLSNNKSCIQWHATKIVLIIVALQA